MDEYRENASQAATEKISEKLADKTPQGIKEIIQKEINNALPTIGLKQKIDDQKKKLLISHASEDSGLADLVHSMLSFNNIPDKDIIYTSSDKEDCRIPDGTPMLDYLRNFFVDSYSTKKIFIVYITSEKMITKWHPVMEVGAMWITQNDHKIFDIKGAHKLEAPLDTITEYHTSIIDEKGGISMSQKEFDKFAVKIMKICEALGQTPKSKELNKKQILRHINLLNK